MYFNIDLLYINVHFINMRLLTNSRIFGFCFESTSMRNYTSFTGVDSQNSSKIIQNWETNKIVNNLIIKL